MSRHSASGNMIGETGVILLILSAVKNDYRIEELVSQSANMVVYRASGKDSQIFALTRLVLSDDIAENLTAEHFDTALAQLKELAHPCLRSVLDGGCDEIDHQPWFVSQWWEGETLEDRLADATFDESDLHRLQGLAQVLIEKVTPYAGALAFQPNQIVSTKAADNSTIETFTIDLYQWMDDWAMGSSPGSTVDPQKRLSRLVTVIQGPPIARPIFPAVIEPPGVTTLASAKSGGGMGKILLIVGTLAALVIGAFLYSKSQNEDRLAENEEVDTAQSPRVIHESAKVTPPEKTVAKVRPKKPTFEWMKENNQVFADDETRLGELVGQWVNVWGKVKSVSDKGEWVFALTEGGEVPLKARLESESDVDVEGRSVSVIGFLEEGHLLKIPKVFADDIIHDNKLIAERRTFSVKDEKTIIGLKGERIRFVGKMLELEAAGSSVYLHFKENKKKGVLAGKISTKNLSKTHNLAFFKALKGKTVGITGKVTQSGSKRGWYVLFERNMDFEVIGEEPQVAKIPEAPEPAAGGMERPPAGEISDLDAADRSARAKKAGRWVAIQGRVKEVNGSGEWTFENEGGEPLKARMSEGVPAEDVEGRLVSVIGLLKSADLFIIERPDDIEVIEEKVVVAEQKEYSIEDQAKIQARAGETVTLRGKVLSSGASGSGKTLYLNFTAKRPVLAIGVKLSAAEEGLDAEFLERFVGHEIAVTGVVEEEYGGHRFVIVITRKDQIGK